MSEIINPNEYLKSLSELSKLVFAKKYHIQTKLRTNLSEQAGKIDQFFAEELGIGVLEISATELLTEYEKKIDKEFNIITNKNLIKYPIESEIELITKSKKVSNSYLNNLQISVHSSRKDFLKKHKFSIPHVKAIVNKSEHVVLIPQNDESAKEDILTISKVKYRNSDFNALFHISPPAQQDTEYSIVTMLLHPINPVSNYSPIRLFLHSLHKYGIDLKINSKTKRFFLTESVVNKRMDGKMDFLEIPNQKKNQSLYVHMEMTNLNFMMQISFAYGIDEFKYFKDLKML